jgi:formylglycine-generating enzyme required for sulfatase activity
MPVFVDDDAPPGGDVVGRYVDNCKSFDYEFDGDVDLCDFVRFQRDAFRLVSEVACETVAPCPETDVNCDGLTDPDDIEVILAPGNWLMELEFASQLRADVNADGFIDGLDVAAIRSSACYLAPSGEMLDMTFVPPGEFEMGDAWGEGGANERPVHTVYISPFQVNKYEVSLAEYAAALNWAATEGGHIEVRNGVVFQAGGDVPYCDTQIASEESGLAWDGSMFHAIEGKEDYPVTRVTWFGAAAYCNWLSAIEKRPLCFDVATWSCDFAAKGYRLPTEAEWEKAARGGDVGRRFPWSDCDTIQHTRANYRSATGYSYDTSETHGYHPDFDDGDLPYTCPVDHFIANDYGLKNAAGNVREWCFDRFSSTYYALSPGSDPTGPPEGDGRVLRGGDWNNNAFYCRCARRYYKDSGYRDSVGGFRLAMTAR